MRAIIIRESLRGRELPDSIRAGEFREYPHALGGKQPVTIVECEVGRGAAPQLAVALSDLLLAEKFYAHIVDSERMLIAFPKTVVQIERGDKAGEGIAKKIGALFSIPDEQMRFLAMFEVDHPDQPN